MANTSPYRPGMPAQPPQWMDPQSIMSQPSGPMSMYSQGQGMNFGPPQAPPMFSQGEGTAGTGAPPGGAPPRPAMAPGQVGNSTLNASDAALLGSMNKLGSERADVDRQRKLADMLRTSGTAQLQGTQAGRIYKAPNAWNMAGNLASSLVGAYKDQQSDLQAKDIAGREAQGAQRTLDILRPGLSGGAGAPAGTPAFAGQQGFWDWLKGGFGGGGS